MKFRLGLGKTFGKPSVDEDSFMVQPMVVRENPKTVLIFSKFAWICDQNERLGIHFTHFSREKLITGPGCDDPA